MHSVLDILRKSESYLAGKGIPEPRLDAEHLLSDALSCARMDLYLRFDRPVEEETLAALRERLARRGKREPLAYLLGWQPFHGLRVSVGPGALVPRPETEELAERTAALLPPDPRRILDLGTGAGAIALWLKDRFPDAEVVGADRSEAALAWARRNAAESARTVEWIRSDWFEGLEGRFDAVIANPPYLGADEFAAAEPEVRDFEPREALVADDAGLADLRRIVGRAPAFLSPGGLLALETGPGHREPLLALAKERKYADAWGEDDLQGRPRFVFARPRNENANSRPGEGESPPGPAHPARPAPAGP